LLVDSQQIQPFACVIKTIKFLLDDEQFFAQSLGRRGNPFLQMFAFAERQFRKCLSLYFFDIVGLLVNSEHIAKLV